jgi:hypothetical protein
MNGLFDLKLIMGLACVALLCLTTGFVSAPFPRWELGEVVGINPPQMTLVIREDSSKETLSLRWDKKTRLWVEPTRRRDQGAAFDPNNLTLGAPVRIMFKKYSHHNLVTRVIRLTPPKNAS